MDKQGFPQQVIVSRNVLTTASSSTLLDPLCVGCLRHLSLSAGSNSGAATTLNCDQPVIPDHCALVTGGTVLLSVTDSTSDRGVEALLFFLPADEATWAATEISLVQGYLEACENKFFDCVSDNQNAGVVDLTAAAECVLAGVRGADPGYEGTRAALVTKGDAGAGLVGGGVVQPGAILLRHHPSPGSTIAEDGPALQLFVMPPIPAAT